MTDNLCMKSVTLPVLIQLCSILELHNVLFLRIHITGFLIAAVNLSHLPCLKGMSQKRPHSRVELPQSGNWCSSWWRVFWGHILCSWFLPLVSTGLRVAAVSQMQILMPAWTLAAALQNLCTASLGAGRVWWGTQDHLSVARYRERAITPHVRISPFRHQESRECESWGREVSLGSRNAALPPRALSSSWSVLNQALSSLHFGKKVSQRNKTFLLLKLGYFSIIYGVFFTVEIIPLKGRNHKERIQFCCICRVHCITQQYMNLLDFLSKVIEKLYRSGHHHKCNCAFS